jgi:hypothetical protein
MVQTVARAYPIYRWRARGNSLRIAMPAVWACLVLCSQGPLKASINDKPGDPLLCAPVVSTTVLVVNGDAGIFSENGAIVSVNAECYTVAIPTPPPSLATTQGGTLTWGGFTAFHSGAGQFSDFIILYTPPTLNFTGTDTFTLPVGASSNTPGGPGAFGGGAGNITVTLNVIPATTTLAAGTGVAALVPVPLGSVHGCPVAPVNGGNGQPAGTQYGCITGVIAGRMAPSHGMLSTTGSTISYTPTLGYTGSDTFSYQAVGIDDYGVAGLNSGDVIVNVTVSATPPVPTVTGVSPSTGPPSGGTSVTITGTSFTGATAVHFGGFNAASFTIVNADTITAVSPTGLSLGTLDITVTTTGGTSGVGVADQFNVNVAGPVPTPALTTWGLLAAFAGLLLFGTRVLQRNPV